MAIEIGRAKTPWWFWLLGGLFLLWNVIGCAIYLMDQMTADATLLESYAERGQAMLDARNAYPIWATAAYALAVWIGLLASILFLMRKKLSSTLFIVSLIFALICFIPTFTNAVVKAGGGDSYWVMPVIVVLIGAFEVLFARKMQSRGVLR
ncbi:hypothetical protein N9W89_13710 [Hellea sp.]|nr:hypothetical protein [Hellea sp.]